MAQENKPNEAYRKKAEQTYTLLKNLSAIAGKSSVFDNPEYRELAGSVLAVALETEYILGQNESRLKSLDGEVRRAESLLAKVG